MKKSWFNFFRNLLLSAGLQLVLVSSQAEARSPISNVVVFGEGAYLTSSGDSQPWAQTFPSEEDLRIKPDSGDSYRIGVSVEFENKLDLTAKFTGISSDSISDSAVGTRRDPLYTIFGPNYQTFYTVGSAAVSSTHRIVDLEIGRTRDLFCRRCSSPSGTVRPFLGVRFLDSEQTTRTEMIYLPLPFYTAHETHKSVFRGVGPSFGADIRRYLSSRWDFRARAAGAVLFGDLRTTNSVTGGLAGFPGTSTTEISRTAYSLEAELALAREIPLRRSKIDIAFGYRLDAFHQVLDTTSETTITGGTFGNSLEDQIFHGPFIRLALSHRVSR